MENVVKKKHTAQTEGHRRVIARAKGKNQAQKTTPKRGTKRTFSYR